MDITMETGRNTLKSMGAVGFPFANGSGVLFLYLTVWTRPNPVFSRDAWGAGGVIEVMSLVLSLH